LAHAGRPDPRGGLPGPAAAATPLTRFLLTSVAAAAGALACALAFDAAAAPSCAPGPGLRQERLAAVVDGDTLALADGRRVRLIGVNAPETKGAGGVPEPGADAAARFVREFLGAERIGLVEGAARTDRYGRTLAHVYRADGASLEAALLSAGLARQVTVPPDLGQLDCLQRAEREARATGRGQWGSGAFAPREVSGLAPGESGFRLLRGRVTAVARGGSSWWVEIDERVALRIARADQRRFSLDELRSRKGRVLEVRGWLVWRDSARMRARGHPPWLMQLRHPAALASGE
jgi:micrococcal nuclease